MTVNMMMKRLFVSLVLVSVILGGCSQDVPAKEPSEEPILRIETGMHIAPIYRIGIDAGNHYLVTGSLDKTIRVWELWTGNLIK